MRENEDRVPGAGGVWESGEKVDVLLVLSGHPDAALALGEPAPRSWRKRLQAFTEFGLRGATVRYTALTSRPRKDSLIVRDRQPRFSNNDVDRLWSNIEESGCLVVVAVGDHVHGAIRRTATPVYQSQVKPGDPRRHLHRIELRGPDAWLNAKELNAETVEAFLHSLSVPRWLLGLRDKRKQIHIEALDLRTSASDSEWLAAEAFIASFKPAANKPGRRPPRRRRLGKVGQAKSNIKFRLAELGMTMAQLCDFDHLFNWCSHGYRIRNLEAPAWRTVHAYEQGRRWSRNLLTAHLNDELWLSTWLPKDEHPDGLTDAFAFDIDIHSDRQQIVFAEVLAAMRQRFSKVYWFRSSCSGGAHGWGFTSRRYPVAALEGLLSLELLRLGLMYREVCGELVKVVEVKVDGLRLPLGNGSVPLDLGPDATKPEMVNHLLRHFQPWGLKKSSGERIPPRGRWRLGLRDVCGETVERRCRRLAKSANVPFIELDFIEVFEQAEREFLEYRQPRKRIRVSSDFRSAMRKTTRGLFPARELLQRPILAYHTRFATTRKIIRSLGKHGWTNAAIETIVRWWLERPGHLSHDLEVDRESVFAELPELVDHLAPSGRKGTRWSQGGGIRYLPTCAPAVITDAEVDWLRARLKNPDELKAALLVAERFRLLGTDESDFASQWFRELLGRRYGGLLSKIDNVVIARTREADDGICRAYRLLLPSLEGEPLSIADLEWETPVSKRPLSASHCTPRTSLEDFADALASE